MDYIKTMRKWIGHETLFTARCGIIIENAGRIENSSECRHPFNVKDNLIFKNPAKLRGFSICASNPQTDPLNPE